MAKKPKRSVRRKAAKTRATRKPKLTARLKVPKALTARKLDEVAQELVAPIQERLAGVDVGALKAQYGAQVGKIAIQSMRGELIGHLAAAGYESKLWEKACC